MQKVVLLCFGNSVHFVRSFRRSSDATLVKKFCQNSTLHGLSDLSEARRLSLKLVWICVLLCAGGAAVYGCYSILDDYVKVPIVVSYFVRESTDDLLLPDLIVCPLNRFDQRFLTANNISKELAFYIQLAFGLNTKHPFFERYLSENVLRKFAQLQTLSNDTFVRLNMTFTEFLEQASLKCQDIFDLCQGPAGPSNCCDNATSVMTFAGRCYRIPGVEQKAPGYGMGMSVVLSLPKQLYSAAPNNFLNDGIVVKMAERGTGIDYDLLFIPAGTHVLMPLKATRYEFMNNPPHFQCRDVGSDGYSRVGCFDDCIWEASQRACNCSHAASGCGGGRYPACETAQFLSCLLRGVAEQLKGDVDSFFGRCRRRCLSHCSYTRYSPTLSYSRFPTDDARRFVANDREWRKLRNTIIIDVYYEQLALTIIQHHRAMTEQGFIANIGGQYSLWLGGSVLTVVQTVLFVVRYAWRKLHRSCTRRHPGAASSAIWKRGNVPATGTATTNTATKATTTRFTLAVRKRHRPRHHRLLLVGSTHAWRTCSDCSSAVYFRPNYSNLFR